MSISITKLRLNQLDNPIGIDSHKPVFGWIIESLERSVLQIAYQIKLSANSDFKNLYWDSGKILSEQSVGIVYSGAELCSMTEYYWKVTVWDNKGNETESKTAVFETAFMSSDDWKAKWVEPIQEAAFHETPDTSMDFARSSNIKIENIKMLPAKMIRKDFVLNKPVKRARAYVTAHGVYYLEINGQIVGDQELAPGHTSYHQYLEYQTYDITEYLNCNNAIGIVLGDGWYAGKIGISGDSTQYGDTLAALFQIEIEYSDSTRETVCSDEQCQGTEYSSIYYNDIYVGEGHDARLEQRDFSTFGFEGEKWYSVQIKEYDRNILHAQYGEPVRIIERIVPKVIVAPNGDVLLDAGQILAGRTMMKVEALRGTKITLEHTEVLTKEGNYLHNILGRFCKQEDTYICKGEGVEVFLPKFTFHGFRYVRIKGYPGLPDAESFEIQALGTDMKQTGIFHCSDSRINQLQNNILWSQKSNMLSIPTDCPQREKAGWTGDAQIFAPTSCFNMDTESFWKRWLWNMQVDQQPDGQIPNVVPYLKTYRPGLLPIPDMTHCSAGWGDAAIIVPWSIYLSYGDITILKDNYDMMKKWIEYVRKTAAEELPKHLIGKNLSDREIEIQKYLWNTNFHFGDWLTPSVSFNFETGDVDMVASAFKTMDIVPTCFYAYSTHLMAKIASILGENKDADFYSELNQKVAWAFQEAYVDEKGLIDTELQGIYVLALSFGLIPENLEDNAINKLLELIRKNDNKLDTGFLSTPFLLDVLVSKGLITEAYNLLFQEDCPSWLYQVKMGATTMWEAWQAILPDGTPTSVSYNHYAFGCIGDWIYRTVAGIEAKLPGYKMIMFKPILDNRITSAKAIYESVYGEISISWQTDNNQMEMTIAIPVNTSAEIILPQAAQSIVLEKDTPLNKVEGIIKIEKDNDDLIITAGSGIYTYSYTFS